jgi:2-polyprenyl-3-methyl-5-hydroxy-6-metoxy-1,4-benzoquinol methylase
MFRYGEHDFDLDYLSWGFHDEKTQIEEAQSVLDILKPARSLRILDIACGVGTHGIYWARQGHGVTGVDISETFINRARQSAERQGMDVEFIVGDIRNLSYQNEFEFIL